MADKDLPKLDFPPTMVVPQRDGSVALVIGGPDAPTILKVSPGGQKIEMYATQGLTHVGQFTAAWWLEANGHLRGWLARKDDQMEWFPARKTRAKKRPMKKQSPKV